MPYNKEINFQYHIYMELQGLEGLAAFFVFEAVGRHLAYKAVMSICKMYTGIL